MDNFSQTLEKARETIEGVIQGITQKENISPAELEYMTKAICAAKELKAIEMTENSNFGEFANMDSNSYRRGRSRTTGRYMSRDGNSNHSRNYYDGSSRSYHGEGNSGHSIRDRMISRLEEMFDEAQTEHERQTVQEWIDRLSYS